jgi:hypothetical protein
VYSSNIISINGLNIMVTLISVYFEYIKILVTYLIIYIFKMRMKAKIYGLKFLVVSQLQLKMFSHK